MTLGNCSDRARLQGAVGAEESRGCGAARCLNRGNELGSVDLKLMKTEDDELRIRLIVCVLPAKNDFTRINGLRLIIDKKLACIGNL